MNFFPSGKDTQGSWEKCVNCVKYFKKLCNVVWKPKSFKVSHTRFRFFNGCSLSKSWINFYTVVTIGLGNFIGKYTEPTKKLIDPPPPFTSRWPLFSPGARVKNLSFLAKTNVQHQRFPLLSKVRLLHTSNCCFFGTRDQVGSEAESHWFVAVRHYQKLSYDFLSHSLQMHSC